MPTHRFPIRAFLGLGALFTMACSDRPGPPPVQQPPPPAATPDAPAPALPATPFALALWPGEGIPRFDAVGSPLPLRTRPDPTAPVHDTLRPRRDAHLDYDSTSHQTVRAVPIEVLRPDTIWGRDFGAVRALSREQYQSSVATVSVPVDRNTNLQLLQHRAEGTCFVALEGRVIEADPCPVFDSGAFRPTGDPVTAWWIYLTGGVHGGGWVLVSDTTVRLAGRTF